MTKRRTFLHAAALSVSACLLLPATAAAGVLKGRVIDTRSRDALAGVNVVLQGTLRGTSTDADGAFRFERVPAGTYALSFSLIGYQRETRPDIQMRADDTISINVGLAAVALQTQPVVVTASRHEQAIQESPVSISVLDAAGIAYRNAVTVDDALRYIPGVNMTQYQVNVRGSSGYSRGVGSRVLLLIDGIPFLTGDTGELNYESIPAGQIERIEVVKGASSALYGSSALGGVINVITKAVPEETETRARTYGGFYGGPSYQQWDWGGGTRLLEGLSLSHSRRIGDLGMTIFGSQTWDAGYRQDDYLRRFNGAAKLRYDISSFQSLTTTFNILSQNHGSFLYWKDLAHALVPPDDQEGETVQSDRFYLTGTYTDVASSDFTYTFRTMWFRNHFTDNVGAGGDDSRSDVVRGEVQATWVPLQSQIVTFGGEGNTDHVNANVFGRHSGRGWAFYLQDELRLLWDLRLTLGGRYDAQDVDSLGSNGQFNPKASLVYTPVPGTTMRASFGRGFRAPSVAEAFASTRVSGFLIVPNPSLLPEHSYSYEVGVNQVLGETALLDAALFRTDYSNLIESGFNAQGQGQFSNVTEARVQGVELSAKLDPFERKVFFELGYTYVYPQDLTADDILKYRPRHILYASAVSHAGLLTAGVDFRYLSRVERIDEQFVILGLIKDGDQRVDSYITDLRFSADLSSIGPPLTASLNINNIFQYNYVELIGNLAPPRTVIFSLEAKL